MTNNREKRTYVKSLHLYMAFNRKSDAKKKHCMRQVIRDEKIDLKVLEARIKAEGGEWRIHKTVNSRDVEKARKWLLKHLIDIPENASFVDTAWKTALLQPTSKKTKLFMLDIDTQDEDKIEELREILEYVTEIIKIVKSPNGYHYITEPFDIRTVNKLDFVTLLRDGYYYVKTIKN